MEPFLIFGNPHRPPSATPIVDDNPGGEKPDDVSNVDPATPDGGEPDPVPPPQPPPAPPSPSPPRIVESVVYSYTTDDPKYNGNNSSLILRINSTAINPDSRFVRPQANVAAFPSELNVTGIAVENQGRDIEITVTGAVNDIRELVRNGGPHGNWGI